MADDGAGRAAAIRHGGGGGGHGARAQEELLQEVPVRMIYVHCYACYCCSYYWNSAAIVVIVTELLSLL